MPLAYYGVTLPDKQNWVETPEGYLIFKNAVVGRTGFQTYKGYELDADELMEQGITVKDDDDVQLYRSPDEVFSPATIASFVGKSVTDGHPSELLSLENVKDHEEGQVVNVRRGAEALESGDFPLVADLIVKSHNLIDKIKAGLRELSCGYNYHVLKDGDVIKQVDIIGNHIAVVENARAGREAVIVDSTPVTSTERFNIMSWLDTVFATNRKAKLASWAKDAKPEDVVEAIEALGKQLDERGEVTTKVVKSEKKAVATDATDAADRKRFHDALDRFFDASEEEEAAKDADVQALADMFKSKGKDTATDEEEPEKKDKPEEGEDEAEDGEEKEGEDDAGALTIEPSDRPKSAGPGTDSVIAARKEGAREVLKLLKPLIAKSGNTKLIAAYDTAARAVQGKSKSSSAGGYSAVAEASSRRGKDAMDSIEESNSSKRKTDEIKALEKLYSDRFTARR